MFTIGNNEGDCTLVVDLKDEDVVFYDFDGNEHLSIPEFDFHDSEYQERWNMFIDEVNSVSNIGLILKSLEVGEGFQVGDLIFYLG